MPPDSRPEDFARIRSAAKFYRISSIITGTLLLLLCVEIILKYSPLAVEAQLAGPQGFLALVPVGTVTAFNLSTGILIVHGWFYVVYLLADFQLWSRMRWRFARFLVIALGGVIPFLSFFLERRIVREVFSYCTAQEQTVPTVEREEAH